jgi:hypothetical protein
VIELLSPDELACIALLAALGSKRVLKEELLNDFQAVPASLSFPAEYCFLDARPLGRC